MKHGSAAQNYTLYMQDMYGDETVRAMLEYANKPKKFYTADYREMIEEWNKQIKEQLERIA